MSDIYYNACTHDYHHITQSVQQNTLHSIEENTLSFADDTDTHCDFSITDNILDTEIQMTYIQTLCQNFPPFTHKENMHTETPLVMHTYSITTLTIKIHLHSKTNIPHYYNKNYKIHFGIYMT